MSVHETAAAAAELGRHLRGRLIMPGDQDWDALRQPWNRRIDQRPAAIVEPAGADDMAATVVFASRHGFQVTAQCTGHGAGADLAGTIVLRTSAMREIVLDPAGGRARVGAGVRCADVLAAGSDDGLAVSAGTAPHAGVAGFAMFGGVGLLGRAVGFMAYQIVAAEVVTADGSVLRVSAASHPDLLWALRGGGGGFALVNRLELRLARVPALFGGQVVWPGEAAPEIFQAWRSWTADLPREMTSSCASVRLPPLPEVPEPLRGRHVAAITACFAGPAAAGAALLKPLARVAAPLVDTCRPLVAADLATLTGALTTDVRHLGGAYAENQPDGAEGAAAVGPTDARYFIESVGLAATAEADAAIRSYQREVTAALAPWTTGTILPSFAEPDTDADPDRVFPPDVRRRLASVKHRYDPAGVLRASFAL